MSAPITAELVREAREQAEHQIEVLLGRCMAKQTRNYEDCTCPSPMPTENELIAAHLNFTISVMGWTAK